MSIAEQITRIETNISNAYTKCQEKGAVIPEQKNSENLASTIDSITVGGGGDKVFAVNNTGADITAGQKIWLNKHNDTSLDSDWTSSDVDSYTKGKFIFPNADNNFVAYNGSDTRHVGTYKTDNKTWTIADTTLANQNTSFYNMNYMNGKYYGWYINPSYGMYGSYNPNTVIYDNNETFEFFKSKLVLSDNWEISIGDSSYKFNIQDRINTNRSAYELDLSENSERIFTAFVDSNKFFIITKGNPNNTIYFRKFSLVWGEGGWTVVKAIGDFPAKQAAITQPCIKYHAGNYLITDSTVNTSLNRGYGLIIYKMKSTSQNNGIVVADDLPDDLQALVGTACVARYDDRTKRLYISNKTDFYLFDFVDGKFVNANLSFDKGTLFTLHNYNYTFSVSDDKTTIFINGTTSSSNGKFQILKLSNPDDIEWYAENYLQRNALSLTGFATGSTDDQGRYEVSTVLGES